VYLKEVIRYSTQNNIRITLQIYCELATVYWELGNDNEARNVQSLMRNFPIIVMHSEIHPMTRSRYLCTTECNLTKDECLIVMRVNRERPNRKEGETIEDTEAMERKINQCYLNITYEVSDGGQDTIYQNKKKVTTPHKFDIILPRRYIQLGRWYEVVVDIYSDEKRENKIGVHHQLVYAIEKE